MGFPGKPKNNLFFNFDSIIGRPGFMATPLKHFLNPKFLTSLGIKSYFPAEIAPEVTNKSISDFKNFLSNFFNIPNHICFC